MKIETTRSFVDGEPFACPVCGEPVGQGQQSIHVTHTDETVCSMDCAMVSVARDMDLYDEANDPQTAEQLGLTDEMYEALKVDSIIAGGDEGWVRTGTGRRVYAA